MDAHLYHHGCKVTKLGLGTDCSGGYSPSMINSMRFAVATSNNVAIVKNSDSFLNYKVKYLENVYIYKNSMFLYILNSTHLVKRSHLFLFLK